jgi:triacylglycerol lipase
MTGASTELPTYVFVHGFLGFDRLGLGIVGVDYWRRLAEVFRGRNLRHLVAQVPPGASIAARATVLQRFLAAHDASNVVLVGHSMGGLDGRHLVQHLDDERRVRCLVTLATPHRGSSLAPWALSSKGPLPRAVRAIGRDALLDLTPEACARRNETSENRPDVRRLSVIAARPRADLCGPLRLLVPDLMDAEGPHDGMVSVASARFGEVVAEVAADHFEPIGWDLSLRFRHPRPRFDHLALLRQLVDLTRPTAEGPRHSH